MVNNSQLSNITQNVENKVSTESGLSLFSILDQATVSISSSTVNNLTVVGNNEVIESGLDEAEVKQGNTVIEG